MKRATVYIYDKIAGKLIEDDAGFYFKYEDEYLESENPEPISLTIPLKKETYTSKILFPFFDGLIPEGWLLDIAAKNWKLDVRDRMSILLATCIDCVGAVSIVELKRK